MIVLIPSYKRTDVLNAVIRSVLNCDLSHIDERVLVVIVNNYYPNRNIIESIIANFSWPFRVEFETIHRKKTIPPVDSWFSAIFGIAEEDEVVFLLGDDDLLLPWGLKNRYLRIKESNADMLLSDYQGQLYFYDGGKKCWLDGELPSPPSDNIATLPWDYLPNTHPNASFMSNHCYRNTKCFREGYEIAMEWSRRQSWVPIAIASGNVPFYMAYAIKSAVRAGTVVSYQEKSVIRGSVVEQTFKQDYADGGNTAFFGLLIFNTFANESLHDDISSFSGLRQIYARSFIKNAVSVLPNDNVPLGMLYKTMKLSGITLWHFFNPSVLGNLYSVLRMLPFLRGFRIKRSIKNGNFILVDSFMGKLNNQQLKG